MTKNIQTAKLNAAIDMLIESDADLSNVLGKEGLIKQLSKRILERALEAEMQSHLGYERYSRSDIDNARNGSYQKNLITARQTIKTIKTAGTSLNTLKYLSLFELQFPAKSFACFAIKWCTYTKIISKTSFVCNQAFPLSPIA